MLDAIDGIDKASATPPVIVVFGDHGSWVGAMPGDTPAAVPAAPGGAGAGRRIRCPMTRLS